MLTVFDIGARGGPDPRWYHLGPAVQVIGVDADAEECERLNQQQFKVPTRFLHAALGRTDGGSATLHITRQPGCSSLLRPNDEYLSQFPYGRDAFVVERTVPLTLTSLDTLCARHDVWPDVLKIDVQGYELEILRGARKALESALLVELEVEFNPLYRDQPLFGELDADLRSHGFKLLGLRRTAWRRGVDGPSAGGTIVHGDALFYRDPVPAGAARRERFVQGLIAYRQMDFAASLGTTVPRAATSLTQRLKTAAAIALGSNTSHKILRSWIDRGRPDGASDWHDPDFY